MKLTVAVLKDALGDEGRVLPGLALAWLVTYNSNITLERSSRCKVLYCGASEKRKLDEGELCSKGLFGSNNNPNLLYAIALDAPSPPPKGLKGCELLTSITGYTGLIEGPARSKSNKSPTKSKSKRLAVALNHERIWFRTVERQEQRFGLLLLPK